jgi:hypothetical protein
MKLGCQQPVNATVARMQDQKAATSQRAQQGYLVFIWNWSKQASNRFRCWILLCRVRFLLLDRGAGRGNNKALAFK